MDTCPVVRIVSHEHAAGFRLINESDFDPSKHQIFEPVAPVVAAPAPKTKGKK